MINAVKEVSKQEYISLKHPSKRTISRAAGTKIFDVPSNQYVSRTVQELVTEILIDYSHLDLIHIRIFEDEKKKIHDKYFSKV